MIVSHDMQPVKLDHNYMALLFAVKAARSSSNAYNNVASREVFARLGKNPTVILNLEHPFPCTRAIPWLLLEALRYVEDSCVHVNTTFQSTLLSVQRWIKVIPCNKTSKNYCETNIFPFSVTCSTPASCSERVQ